MNAAKWELFPKGQFWKFRLVAANGSILMESARKYSHRKTAQGALTVIKNLSRQDLATAICKTG